MRDPGCRFAQPLYEPGCERSGWRNPRRRAERAATTAPPFATPSLIHKNEYSGLVRSYKNGPEKVIGLRE
jgi:hypothetical protein